MFPRLPLPLIIALALGLVCHAAPSPAPARTVVSAFSSTLVPDVINSKLAGSTSTTYQAFSVQEWIESGNTTETMSASQKSKASVHLSGLGKRSGRLGGVFFCTDKNWKGTCIYLYGGIKGQCINLGQGWRDAVSSFGPDQKNACDLFSATACATANLPKLDDVKFPGIANLDVVPVNLNDQVSSYSCTW